MYLNDAEIKEELRKKGKYKKTIEKAHSQLEIREYYQTKEIGWLSQKKDWKGLKSIGMEEEDDTKRRSGEKRDPLLYQQPK